MVVQVPTNHHRLIGSKHSVQNSTVLHVLKEGVFYVAAIPGVI